MAAAAVHGRAFAKRMFSHGKENHVATPPKQAKLPTQMPSPTSRREISPKPKPTLPKSAEKITCVADDLLRPSLVQGSDRALATRGYSFYNIVILGWVTLCAASPAAYGRASELLRTFSHTPVNGNSAEVCFLDKVIISSLSPKAVMGVALPTVEDFLPWSAKCLHHAKKWRCEKWKFLWKFQHLSLKRHWCFTSFAVKYR